MPPRRVLVLSASVGAGHLRAAQAVELALREVDPSSEVKNLDVLQMTSGAFRRLYGQAYLDLVNRAPHVLGYFYDILDKPRSARRRGDKLRLLVEKMNLRPFLKLLREESWDVIINTHFLPAEIIASLRAKGDTETPQFTVTTDFETHRLWVNEPCDHYFTATEEGALYLEHWGVARERISTTGIPIHPAFARPPDRAACLSRQGLHGDRPVVLQLSGGFGVGPVEQIYRAALSVATPVELVVVAGRNEELRKRLESIEGPLRHRVKVLGYTQEIHDLMAAADIVISKPGGLTTSEVLASGAAMAIVNPIPGQESRNSDYLLEMGAAIKINHVATLAHKLARLIAEPCRLTELRENARRIGRPRAAFEIASRALSWD